MTFHLGHVHMALGGYKRAKRLYKGVRRAKKAGTLKKKVRHHAWKAVGYGARFVAKHPQILSSAGRAASAATGIPVFASAGKGAARALSGLQSMRNAHSGYAAIARPIGSRS